MNESNNLINSGIYGIWDTANNEIVYIGSTKNTFAYRWGVHVQDAKKGKHCNPELAKIINTGNFYFEVLEITNKTGSELLEREAYYTETFKPKYSIRVGGGTIEKPYIANIYYKPTMNVKLARDYIMNNWYNKKFYNEDREIISTELAKYDISSPRFRDMIRKLGFVIHSFSDKRSYIITDTVFNR